MFLEGTVVNGKIKLDGDEKLPEGWRVMVAVTDQVSCAPVYCEKRKNAASPLGEALVQLAGIAEGLTEDMAAQHDHYLHGTPSR